MLPSKRPKIEMEEGSSSWKEAMTNDLENIKGEIEPVDVKKSSSSKIETVTYKPTYRAVLARKGLLVKQTLGSGSYSKVKFAYCIEYGDGDDRKAAVKIIDRNKAPKDFQNRFLPRELAIWPKMKHANIVRFIELFEDTNRVYMVLEYAERGDVLRYIQKSGAIPVHLARNWIRQVSDAVRYLHDQDITHRDLKLENLLLDKSFNVKICDFGFVKEDSMKDLSKTYCGSKSYASPEILRGEPYDPSKADIWALGVILYIFVTGKMPFDESKGNHGVLDEQKKLNFPWHKFKYVTQEEKQMILWLFQPVYSERPNIHTVLETGWMQKGLPEAAEQVGKGFDPPDINNENFREIIKDYEQMLEKRHKSKT